MIKYLKRIFKSNKLDFEPHDATHYEFSISGEYKVYWKECETGLYLWNGAGHYWQEMKHVNFDKHKTKLHLM